METMRSAHMRGHGILFPCGAIRGSENGLTTEVKSGSMNAQS